MSLYVEVQYQGDWWGEDPITETRHETTGDLYRSLSGRDKRYPWEALGRCTGKVYVDGPHVHHAGCLPTGPNSMCRTEPSAIQVGWVFVARNPEPVNRGDEQPTGLREAWVTVHEAPPTVTTIHHYAPFGEKG
jgi:hypothetical protein